VSPDVVSKHVLERVVLQSSHSKAVPGEFEPPKVLEIDMKVCQFGSWHA
jgi:hypothetical protein